MKEQVRARDSISSSISHTTEALTKSHDDSRILGYAYFEDFTNGLGDKKPFQPGYFVNNSTGGFDDTIRPEMAAGVDNIGLLQGAMAMMVGTTFKNVKDDNLTEDLNSFYAMRGADTSTNISGLDSGSLPVFEASDSTSYENILRLTPSDIERNSVIIPDVRDIQAGDLLVRNGNNDFHVGIVIGVYIPVDADTVSEGWDKVYVLSVRPGFQMVNLGTWGNPNGLFGGFTEHPKEYVVRRLMKVSSDPIGKAVPDWESVHSVYFQWYEDYEENEAYWNGSTVRNSDNDGNDKYKELIKNNTAVYVELPPTSYRTNILKQPMFKYNNIVEEKIAVSSYPGWRDIDDRITYHRGVDLVPVVNNSANAGVLGAETTVEILAPEDGKYWVLDLKYDALDDQPIPLYIKIDEDNILVLEDYNPLIYGDLGILVSEPEDPQKGRIYVFAHIYYDGSAESDENDEKSNLITKNVTGCKDYYSSNSSVHFVDVNRNMLTELPTSYDNGGYVKAGDWIGLMAGNSGSGYFPHVHMEVYEYFDQFTKDGDDYYQNDETFPNNLNLQLETNYTLVDLKDFTKWQRVNGRFIFSGSIIVERDKANEPQIVLDNLEGHPEDWWGDQLEEKPLKLQKLFKDWILWSLPEGEN